MDNTNDKNAETETQVIPSNPIQVWLARIGILIAFSLLIAIIFFGRTTVAIKTNGDETIYTATSTLGYVFYIMPTLVGMGAIVLLLQRQGVIRFLGVFMGSISVWLLYTVFTMDTGNHQVIVSPLVVISEIGTRTKPVLHAIHFPTTRILSIDQIPGQRGPEYELVAISNLDGAESRIPVHTIMRAALPQIFSIAREHEISIEKSATGEEIPAALRNEDGQ